MTRRCSPRCSGGFSLAGLTPILVFMKSTRTAAVAAAIVLVGAAASTATAQADPAPAPPPAPAPATTIDADGTYAVGKDIQPGRYGSAGPVDNALTKKAQVVEIEPTDTSFTTNECQAWQLTDAPLPAQGPGDLLGQLGQLAPIIAHNSAPPPPSTP